MYDIKSRNRTWGNRYGNYKLRCIVSNGNDFFCFLWLFLNGIPFPLSAETPNEVTMRAIMAAEKGEMASFSSIDDLIG